MTQPAWMETIFDRARPLSGAGLVALNRLIATAIDCYA